MLGKARRQAPADAQAVSHKLLVRAAYIDQLASGIFSLLPLGYLAISKVQQIVRDEMLGLGAAEVFLPALQPAQLWEESGRLSTIDPPLFRVQDRHNKELVLGSTHEEVITDLARKNIESYKDLPLSVFQIQTKFRNEMRATGGLLRVREFMMKDLYSFHRSAEDLSEYYEKVQQAYLNIFRRCDLKAFIVEADSGSIGGAVSHEYSVEAPTGEDEVKVCANCGFAANTEVNTAQSDACPKCGGTFELKSCIENGHTFQLGTKYSEKMGALFNDQDGQKQPIVMGCYGIGIGRLLAAIAETHHDDKGLSWPRMISPVDVHVVGLQSSVQEAARKVANEIHQSVDVLIDDRDASPGVKLAESDLLGIPYRVIVSEKTEKEDKIEVSLRAGGSTRMMTVNEFVASLQ